MESEKLVHEIAPVYDEKSEILILGTFPSVKSRKEGFFYGNPQNRFWRVLAYVLNCPCPKNTEEKKQMLLKNHVALWDVLRSCEIRGSADAAIRCEEPNDFSEMLKVCAIKAVFLNGSKAGQLYKKYLNGGLNLPYTVLPSTSPANARWKIETLQEAWAKEIRAALA